MRGSGGSPSSFLKRAEVQPPEGEGEDEESGELTWLASYHTRKSSTKPFSRLKPELVQFFGNFKVLEVDLPAQHATNSPEPPHELRAFLRPVRHELKRRPPLLVVLCEVFY